MSSHESVSMNESLVSLWSSIREDLRPERISAEWLFERLKLGEQNENKIRSDMDVPGWAEIDILRAISEANRFDTQRICEALDNAGFKRTLFVDGWFYVPPAKFAFLKPRPVPGTKKEIIKDLRDAEKASRQTYVYFLQPATGGSIKIGKTDDIKRRLEQLQTASANRLLVLLLIPETEATERELHAAFADHRIREDGEWFHPHDDIIDFIHNRHFTKMGIE